MTPAAPTDPDRPANPTPTPERPYYAEDTGSSIRWVVRRLGDVRTFRLGLNKDEAEYAASRFNDAHAAALESKRLADEAPRLAAENKLMRDALEKIRGMTPGDLNRFWDEWGEAACYAEAKRLANDTLAKLEARE